MTRRRLKVAIIVCLIILLALLCGTAFALMYRQTQELNNQLEAAVVDCTVLEEFNGTEKSSITVKNTGNIDAYLRLRMVSYWVDSNGKIVSKPSKMPTVTVAAGWVVGSDNTYYYSKPIAPGGITPDLLDENMILIEEGGYLQVVEVFADAIQSKPPEAVTKSWGVTIDGDSITVAP